MGAFIGQFVQGPRVVPQGVNRTSTDKLPNGHLDFRVTQRFSSSHDGTDLGNYMCGDVVLAPHHGDLRNRKDSYGALITEITEPDGRMTAFGHLSRFARTNGPVRAGQVIGYVGATGLGNVCHIHLTRRVAGRNVDPWPLLEQNRACTVNAGVNIRNQPAVTARIHRTTTATQYRGPYPSGWHWVTGGYHGIGPYPNQWRKLWIDGAYRYVARPLVVLR